MIDINQLHSFDVEYKNKQESLCSDCSKEEEVLYDLIAVRFKKEEVSQIKRIVAFAKSLKSTNAMHSNYASYFVHPLRVATLLIRICPQSCSVDGVVACILHNVFEVCSIGEQELLDVDCSKKVIEGIRTMTVDRQREFEDGYLKEYYVKITQQGREWVIIKSLDKLDNIWGVEVCPDQQKIINYLNTIQSFVVPFASGVSEKLGQYIEEACATMLVNVVEDK